MPAYRPADAGLPHPDLSLTGPARSGQGRLAGSATSISRPPAGRHRACKAVPCKPATDPAIGGEGLVRPGQHLVKGVGQFLELVPRPGQPDPLAKVLIAPAEALRIS